MTRNQFARVLTECGFTLKGIDALWQHLPKKGANPEKMTPFLLRLAAVDFKQNRFRLGIPPDWFYEITQPGKCSTCGHNDHGTERCASRTLTGRCGCQGKKQDYLT